jgi:hypothetical protein
MNPREKAKAILAAIIEVAGGSFNGKTRLYKAFYFAHLMHFKVHDGVLSDYPIVRLPRGPAVDAGDLLLRELRDQGVLQLGQRPVGPYVEEVFTLRQKIGGLTIEELDSIRQAVAHIGDRAAVAVSDETHEFSNTWDDTDNGRQMNIYADLLTESEYDEMKQRHREIGEAVDAIFTG